MRAVYAPLSPREREVAQLVLDGLGRKAIAERLGLTRNAVKWHLTGLSRKIPGDRPLPQRLVLWAMDVEQDLLWCPEHPENPKKSP